MKKRKAEEVEIQITPMLDMAFQLLTFFILTYHPSPTETQFAMNLMPPAPVSKPGEAPTDMSAASSDLPAPLRTVTTTLRANDAGGLGRVSVGESDVPGATHQEIMDALKSQLATILGDKTLPFDQALIQVDPKLKYEELVKVIHVFSELNVTKVSFAELDASGANP